MTKLALVAVLAALTLMGCTMMDPLHGYRESYSRPAMNAALEALGAAPMAPQSEPDCMVQAGALNFKCK
jgi:hypothetical protein